LEEPRGAIDVLRGQPLRRPLRDPLRLALEARRVNPEAGHNGDGHTGRREKNALDHRTMMALLFLGGLLISGFTILRGIEPFDEGLTLQAARRIADGQVPYRDFLWAYGPAHIYLLAGLFKAFGTSLLWWRIIRVLVDAGVAVLVFAIVRREAPAKVALVAWLASACAMAQPTGANPFAPALLFTLAAILVVAGGDADARGADARGADAPAAAARSGRRRLIIAGLLCALAGAWRIDFGIYAVIACVAAAAAGRPSPRAGAVARPSAFRAAGTVLASFSLVTLLVYLPFVILDGPADAWRDLFGRSLSQGGRYWHLPFPISYDGRFRLWPPGSLAGDLKDLLAFYVPLLLVVGVLAGVAAIAFRRLQRDALIVGLGTLAITYVAYLLSRTDEFHSAPLIVVVATLLTILALRIPMRGAAVLALIVLALLVYGLSNRLSALLAPPALATVHVPVADGVEAPPAEARAIEQMVAAVQRRVPRGDPIYTVTRRSDLVRINSPMIYVLTERNNPTRQDFGLQTSASAQAAIIAALERARPKAIVRWTDPISTVREPNDRGKPSGVRTLDRWLAAHYHRANRYGYYEILVPRQ
jgi:hypothetical protein